MAEHSTHLAGSMSGRLLLRITDLVAARGHDAEALCRGVGLRLSALREPDTRVPYGLVERLCERAAEQVDDPNIGLHLAHEIRDPRSHDEGTLMLMASPSIRVALESMQRYQRYWGDGDRTQLVPSPGGLAVRYLFPGPPGPTRRHIDECALAEILIGIRTLSALDVVPRAVRFAHPAPADTREHRELFRAPIEFHADHSELDLDDTALDAPMKHANAVYCAIFQQQVERALARLPAQSGLAADVRAAAQAALAGGGCTLAGTARVLGISERTLQRRLSAEGTSFGELIEALRREMAEEYLARKLPIAEIAWLLGYADASAFHHAFKRWTGKSPEQARGVLARL